MEFYTKETVTEHILRIRPFWNDACMYYVMGEERDLLIDTGYGFGALKEYVDSLSDHEYDVVLSHGHLDHAGGCGEWDSVYMHHADIALYQEKGTIPARKEFLKSFVKNIEKYPEDMFIQMYTHPFKDLQDGMVFDLGGVHVQCIGAPGHTKGMMVFLVKEDRTILFGDACGVFTLFILDEATSLEEYASTLHKLKSYESQYDRILRQHGTCESPKELLDEDIRIVQSILDKTDDHQPFEFHGTPCFIARKLNDAGKRADGKEGNVLYVEDKIYRKG